MPVGSPSRGAAAVGLVPKLPVGAPSPRWAPLSATPCESPCTPAPMRCPGRGGSGVPTKESSSRCPGCCWGPSRRSPSVGPRAGGTSGAGQALGTSSTFLPQHPWVLAAPLGLGSRELQAWVKGGLVELGIGESETNILKNEDCF